jgi:hypothetical protein
MAVLELAVAASNSRAAVAQSANTFQTSGWYFGLTAECFKTMALEVSGTSD